MAQPSFKDFIQVANAQGITFPASVNRLAMDADPQPSEPPRESWRLNSLRKR